MTLAAAVRRAVSLAGIATLFLALVVGTAGGADAPTNREGRGPELGTGHARRGQARPAINKAAEAESPAPGDGPSITIDGVPLTEIDDGSSVACSSAIDFSNFPDGRQVVVVVTGEAPTGPVEFLATTVVLDPDGADGTADGSTTIDLATALMALGGGTGPAVHRVKLSVDAGDPFGVQEGALRVGPCPPHEAPLSTVAAERPTVPVPPAPPAEVKLEASPSAVHAASAPAAPPPAPAPVQLAAAQATGTIRVDGTPISEVADNASHDCSFELEFSGFPANQRVTVAFAGEAPTAPNTFLADTFTLDNDGADRTADGSKTFDLAAPLSTSGVTADPALGYHIKLLVDAGESLGLQQKTFWVTPCPTGATTTRTATATAAGQPAQAQAQVVARTGTEARRLVFLALLLLVAGQALLLAGGGSRTAPAR